MNGASSRFNIDSLVDRNAKKGVATKLPTRALLFANANPQQKDVPNLENVKPVFINKDNIDNVMEGMEITLNMNVKNTLKNDNSELGVKLKINSMKDFSPDSIAEKVPDLKILLTVKQLLTDLKSKMITNREFLKELNNIVRDPEKLKALENETKSLNMIKELIPN
ncbi:Uncharacterized conserved protein UCP028301 [Candidatus Magnetomorum sp. HK-1]|nr:Uncharacterized conserved protein UCP028301 [Candidatus Magnetomorum sp. HK-1]